MKNKLLIIMLFFFMIPLFSSPQEPVFIDGILIQGYDVAGLTDLQAKEKLTPFIKEILNQNIIVISPDRKQVWITSYQEMGLEIDLEKAILEGLDKGNKGLFLKRWWDILKIKREKHNIPLKLQINHRIAVENIIRLTKSLVKDPQEARITINSQNKVIIIPDISGIGIDLESILNQLETNLKLQGPLNVVIKTKEIKAKLTSEDIRKMNVETLLGQFTTWFNPQKKNRSQNIKKAAQALDEFLLEPGEEFSFNEIVGPRTKEAGYNDAPIILNNQFVEGIGGGVCQVSSTLYNVLLRANLLVTERHPHSLPIRYVPKGMDAAVVYGLKDLKFLNNTQGYIFFKTYVGQGALTMKIFGAIQEDQEVEIISIVEKTFTPETIFKNKPDLLIGQIIVEQQGAQGYIVRVERIIRDNKKNILMQEILTRDYYPPVNKIILTAKH